MMITMSTRPTSTKAIRLDGHHGKQRAMKV